MTMSLLSPKEFEYLQEKQKTKEDSIKYRTSKLETQTTDNLQNILPLDLIQADLINDDTSACEIITDLSFAIETPDKLILDYELLRDDITKDWVNSKSTHSGRVTVHKSPNSKNIVFKSEFTSSETQDINKEIVNRVKNHLILNEYVYKNTEMVSISSNNFTNKERFAFMLQLANHSPNGFLRFEAVSNIEIGPAENAKLPSDAKWMADCVKNMIINGESLQNIEYIRNPDYHNSLILREIAAKYSFKTGSAKGTCIIEYGFPHYFRKYSKDKSFQVSIPKVYFSKSSKSNNIKNVSRMLLNEFEEMKDLKYTQIKRL